MSKYVKRYQTLDRNFTFISGVRCILGQCAPSTGPRAAYGPSQRCQWPGKPFTKNLQI